MNLFEQDNGCCGAEFNKSHISLLGLLTLSVPLIYISFFILILIYPFTYIFKIKTNLLKILIESNLVLIRQKNIFSKFKCSIASKLMIFSPRIAGLVFKFFNFYFLSILLIIIILFISWILI